MKVIFLFAGEFLNYGIKVYKWLPNSVEEAYTTITIGVRYISRKCFTIREGNIFKSALDEGRGVAFVPQYCLEKKNQFKNC